MDAGYVVGPIVLAFVFTFGALLGAFAALNMTVRALRGLADELSDYTRAIERRP